MSERVPTKPIFVDPDLHDEFTSFVMILEGTRKKRETVEALMRKYMSDHRETYNKRLKEMASHER